MSVEELLASICEEFHIEMPAVAASVKMLVDAINAHLLRANAQGRRAVLIIDEAQNLRTDVLEQLRLLTNLETNTRTLLQIILIGQPELKHMLRQPELREVAQRIAGTQLPVFPYSLIGPLYRMTGGVPRLINLVCDRALLGTYVQRKLQVTPKTLKKAAHEVIDSAKPRRLIGLVVWLSLVLAAAGAGGVFAATLLPLPLWSISWAKTELDSVAAAPAPAPATQVLQRPPASASAGEAAVPPKQISFASVDQPAIEELRWPDATLPRGRSEGLAFQDLFNLYGIAYAPGVKGSACKIAETANMRSEERRVGK